MLSPDLPRAEPHPHDSLAKSRRLVCILLALAVWIARWHFPEASAAPLLDASFMQALGHALVHGQQFGTDIVFTYGPLGWFNASPHQPELFWTKCLAWEFAFKLVVASFVAVAASRLRSKVALLLLAFALVVPEYGFDASWFLGVLAIAVWCLERRGRSVAWLLLPFAALALIALVKFTYTMLVVVVVLAIVGDIARDSIRRASLALVIFLGFFVLSWSLAGQSPQHIVRWFATSSELASAFSSAMSAPSTTSLLVLALVSGACTIAAIFLRGRIVRKEGEMRGAALPLIALATLYLAFKAGFTRATGNEITFFGVAAALPFLIGDIEVHVGFDRVRRARAFTVARIVALVVAFAGFCAASGEHGESPTAIARSAANRCMQNVRTALTLPTLRRSRDEERAETARKFAVPVISARIGNATVDVFAAEQALAFLHDWNWHPRPVFQSYSVFTDSLSAANAEFLAGDDAPEFVVFRAGAIDERLANSEDARSLRVVIRDYRLAVEERGFMLFERARDRVRTVDDARSAEAIVLERDIALGETLDLESLAGEVLVIDVDASLDVVGRLRSAIFRSPRLDAIQIGNDGSTATNRIVPELVRAGVVVRPWLAGHEDWMRWYLGDSTRSIRSMCFVAEDGGYRHRIHVRVMRAESLRPRREAGDDAKLRYSMFVDAPSTVESAEATRRTTFRGYREALVVTAPSVMRYERAAGTYAISATFGFVPEAWRDGETDGAIVRVDLVARDGARKNVFTRTLDPKRNAVDGKEQSLALAAEVESGEHIEFVVDPGAANAAQRDWIFWSNVQVARRVD